MTRPPSVLLLDDGDLEVVRDVLEELDVKVVHRRDRVVRASRALDHDLLVTTGRRALAAEQPFRGTSPLYRPTWITLHNQDFLPMRNRLRHNGVDYLVQSMVDPEVLRILLCNALFSGTERRAAPRLPVGSAVSFESDESQGLGLLAEMAPRSCRILATHRFEPGERMHLKLPPSLSGGTPRRLSGHLVRVSPQVPRPGKQAILGMMFDSHGAASGTHFEAVRGGGCIGTRVTCLGGARGAVVQTDPTPVDRRFAPRVAFEGRVTALRGQTASALEGRDLSAEGVRVAADDVPVGSVIELAIQGARREEPVFLRATAIRQAGGEVALTFHGPCPVDLARLLDRLSRKRAA